MHAKKHWYLDRYQNVVVMRNRLFILTMVCLAMLCITVYTVVITNSKKGFNPAISTVEEETNYVSKVSYIKNRKIGADENLIRALIFQYVSAREGYNPTSYKENYDKVVRLMSGYRAFNSFQDTLRSSDKANPLRLGRKSERVVDLKDIEFLGGDRALIRISATDQRLPSKKKMNIRHYYIVVEYLFNLDIEYSSTQESYYNPLGFRIEKYDRVLEYDKKSDLLQKLEAKKRNKK